MKVDAPQASDARAQLSALIGSVASGDSRALQAVYEKTSAKILGVIFKVLPQRHEAEEVLQDVYVTVWSKAAHFDAARGSPITWLATIARNKAIDRRRSMRSWGEELSDKVVDTVPDGAPSAFDNLEWSQDRDRLYACLDTLEPRLKTAISEAFLNGSTYLEIG